ncbi:MAG: hypothetical protein PUB89_00205 [Oscillospiraceae bacterium]|nr:hypothetical protein [Oscillospiraceae bacterium]
MQNENIKVINNFITKDTDELKKKITVILERIINSEAEKMRRAG